MSPEQDYATTKLQIDAEKSPNLDESNENSPVVIRYSVRVDEREKMQTVKHTTKKDASLVPPEMRLSNE